MRYDIKLGEKRLADIGTDLTPQFGSPALKLWTPTPFPKLKLSVTFCQCLMGFAIPSDIAFFKVFKVFNKIGGSFFWFQLSEWKSSQDAPASCIVSRDAGASRMGSHSHSGDEYSGFRTKRINFWVTFILHTIINCALSTKTHP